MKIITPINMVPYKGWRFIINEDGCYEHVPTAEWMQDILEKMKAVTKYAEAVEGELRRYKNENPDGANDKSIVDAIRLLNI